MRKLQCMALLFVISMCCACEPLRPGNALPAASANPTPPPAETMPMNTSTPEQTIDQTTESPAATDGLATPVPTEGETASPQPTAAPPADFEGVVSGGLTARWQGSQAIVVRALGGVEAEMWLYERSGEMWKPVAGPWQAVIGVNGMSKRAEGDNRSPSGAFLLGTAFGRAARPQGMKYQYTKLDGKDRWVDSVSSPFYNRWVRGPESVCGNGEDLSEIEQYKYALAVHYNDEGEAGAGSAIFIHVWRGPGQGTHGCTALSEAHMVQLLRWLDYGRRPVLVQGTDEEIKRLMAEDWNMFCLPEGWGFADDFVADAQLEICYNTANNVTGRIVPGYSSRQAPMRTEAINALVRVAKELRARNYGIYIFDAYRPQQATDAMIAWAEDEKDTATKKLYYPGIDKSDIPGRYIARLSNHRLGGTVDLTIVSWKNGKNLDMGTRYDYFGERSGIKFKGVTKSQAANRKLLRGVMVKFGFKPYDAEWWHFTYPVKGDGGEFPILPREHVLK